MSSLSLSLEFFPPRSEVQQRRFWYAFGCLQTLNPEYISMTWGALGSTSKASLDILEQLVQDVTVPITAHLSCAGQTQSQMQEMIDQLQLLGITRFLALRGDSSAGGSDVRSENDALMEHASDLVQLLSADSTRDISVAAYPESHPESRSVEDDIHWLKHKLDAGAKRAITQFFFEPETFLRFRDKAVVAGVSQTLVPGILPIHDIEKVADFSNRCGATIPRQLITEFRKATTPESRHWVAVEQCVNLCQKLHEEGVNEVHLYTLNQAPLAYDVGCELLGKSGRSVVAAI